jgi:hypothetical protein
VDTAALPAGRFRRYFCKASMLELATMKGPQATVDEVDVIPELTAA